MKKRMLRAAVAALMVLCVGVVGLQVQAAGERRGNRRRISVNQRDGGV